jgi:hypothetical protein
VIGLKNLRWMLFAILCLCLTAAAQSEKQTPPEQTTAPTKQNERGSSAISAVYDKAKDETTVKTRAMSLSEADADDKNNRLEMYLIYTFQSSTQTSAVDHALILFNSRAREAKFKNNYKVVILADGQVILPKAQFYEDQNARSANASSVSEHLGVTATLEQIEAIAKAQTVEIQIGEHKYQLRPAQIGIYKLFAERMSGKQASSNGARKLNEAA